MIITVDDDLDSESCISLPSVYIVRQICGLTLSGGSDESIELWLFKLTTSYNISLLLKTVEARTFYIRVRNHMYHTQVMKGLM